MLVRLVYSLMLASFASPIYQGMMLPMRALNATGVKYILRIILAGILYTLAVYVSLFLVPQGSSGASLVWPPAAIGMAILLLGGFELWPGIFLSYFISLLMRGYGGAWSLGIAGSSLLEALIVAYLLVYFFKFDIKMTRSRDTFAFIFSALIATMISGALLQTSSFLFGSRPFDLALWEGIVLGHTVSLLSFGPFLITWFNKQTFSYSKWNIAEKTAVLGSIALLNFLMFWTPYGSIGSISLIYILMIPLIWTAVRLSVRGMSLALALTAGIAVTGILFGYSGIHVATGQILFGVQVLIGTITLIFLIFSSITEERRAAVSSLQEHVNKLESLLTQIRSADAAKNEFIAILAHELRNPLAPIVSSVELIKEGIAPAHETKKLVGIIDDHVRTLARLLDDMLDISRISQKKFHLHTEAVSLQSVVELTLQTVETYMKLRNHTLTIRMPKEPVLVEGDKVRLEQALVNLLNNAAKYTEPGGKITLAIETKGSHAVISITDTGVGIPESMQKLIFEPFSTTSAMRRPGGLGVGLYLTKRLVELHNGTIGVVSEGKNKGSRFIVNIPLAQKPSTVVSVADVLAQKPLSITRAREEAARTILIVDDNEPAATGLSTLLAHSGHITHTAHSGASALEASRALKPSVVLLDIGLPDMEGYEVAKQMREEREEPFVLIALTGYGQEDDKKRAREAGFDHHLTKPVGIADVQKLLATAY